MLPAQPGYNPANGKVKSLFRWDGTASGQLYHPDGGQIVPILWGLKLFIERTIKGTGLACPAPYSQAS